MDPRIETLLRQLLQERKNDGDNSSALRRLQNEQESCFPWQKLHPHAPSPRRATDPVDNLVLIISERGTILSVNHALERLVGRHDLVGSSVWELFPQPTAADLFRARLHTFLSQGERQQFELPLTTSRGNQHLIFWSFDRWPHDDGRTVVIAGLEVRHR